MNYVYALIDDDVFTLDIKGKLLRVIENQNIYKDDNYFNNLLYFTSYDMNVYYFIIIEYNEVYKKVKSYDYDTLVKTNKNLIFQLTQNYSINNLEKIDKFFISNDKYHKIWYNFYFKRNLDIFNLINVFSKLQNENPKYFIGNQTNIDNFKSSLKNYYIYLFGKYDIVLNYLNIFDDIFIYFLFYKKNKISLNELLIHFKKYEFMQLFIKYTFYKILNKNIKIENINNFKLKIDIFFIYYLLIYFYSKIYINHINDIFHDIKSQYINELLYIKKLYFNSISKIKLNELISIFIIFYYDNYNYNYVISSKISKNIIFDFDIKNENIVINMNDIYKTNDEIINYIKLKYSI